MIGRPSLRLLRRTTASGTLVVGIFSYSESNLRTVKKSETSFSFYFASNSAPTGSLPSEERAFASYTELFFAFLSILLKRAIDITLALILAIFSLSCAFFSSAS